MAYTGEGANTGTREARSPTNACGFKSKEESSSTNDCLQHETRTMIVVRPERIADFASVRKINEEAFGQPNEADLVYALRMHVSPYISLVAQLDRQLVGHIFFSPVTVQSEEASFLALGLAPMAVLPEFQKQGIGSQLVREGLKECLRIRHPVVVVLGHPGYYTRFGFAPAKPKGILCRYPVPDDVFMVIELTPGALGGRRGMVTYHPDFDAV